MHLVKNLEWHIATVAYNCYSKIKLFTAKSQSPKLPANQFSQHKYNFHKTTSLSLLQEPNTIVAQTLFHSKKHFSCHKHSFATQTLFYVAKFFHCTNSFLQDIYSICIKLFYHKHFFMAKSQATFTYNNLQTVFLQQEWAYENIQM